MKTRTMLETLVLAAALTASQAGAAPISLQGSTISASYNGSGAGMLGLDHLLAVGWAGAGVNGQPAPNPAVARADAGWREYGSLDMAGSPLHLGARVGGYILSDTDVANRFATREKVFAAYGNGAGWNPQP